MKKIVFVCLGNICRSPMAEFVFKRLIRDAGVAGEYVVESRATSYEEENNPVYPPAASELRKHGVDCAEKYASRLEKSDYDKYDLIICMEEANVKNVLRIVGSDPERKIVRLLDYTEEKGDIADPYFTRDFRLTYNQIEKGCKALLATLQAE